MEPNEQTDGSAPRNPPPPGSPSATQIAARQFTEPQNTGTRQSLHQSATKFPFYQAFVPVLILIASIVYGLVIHPQWVAPGSPLPLELIFILAASLTIGFLLGCGYTWESLQNSITKRLREALPAFFILFAIGLIIASWILCGTIPMLVCWGLELIRPQYIYIVAFIAPIFFSTLTGTSWGSVGTIGVVILGIATALDANLGIVAGAIIGGAYFGDKLSPLSDTTNLAALAADVDLFEHIRSMMYTTLPATALAALIYTALGFVYPPAIPVDGASLSAATTIQDSLRGIFNFNILLLVPALIVLIGSVRRMPTLPVLMTSILSAVGLTFGFQQFSIESVATAMKSGFTIDMVSWTEATPGTVVTLLERGGLYQLNEAITIAFMVFVLIGAMDRVEAMPTVVARTTGWIRSARLTVFSALATTAATNALTSNQSATSFIVGDAFKSRFDREKIPRHVLSRSLEDTGTMLESLLPWTTTSVYMVATLGVPHAEYARWQLLSLLSISLAIVYSLTGWFCWLPARREK